MENDNKHVIVFHGTTSAFDETIRENGFLTKPMSKLSQLVSTSLHAETDHLVAFDGTYVAIDMNVSTYYARKAAEIFGGEARIYALRVPLAAMVPDEDEVHFALSCHLADVLGFDDNSLDEFQFATREWSLNAARDTVQGIAEFYGMDDGSIEDASKSLHVMIEPTIQDWDGDLLFFHPNGNDQGWSSPHWVRKLTSLEGGFDIYREKMDDFLGCMRGSSPETCPAGFDAFKGRITDTFKFRDNTNGVDVIGYGSLDDPFEHYSDLMSVNGEELVLMPDFLENIHNSKIGR